MVEANKSVKLWQTLTIILSLWGTVWSSDWRSHRALYFVSSYRAMATLGSSCGTWWCFWSSQRRICAVTCWWWTSAGTWASCRCWWPTLPFPSAEWADSTTRYKICTRVPPDLRTAPPWNPVSAGTTSRMWWFCWRRIWNCAQCSVYRRRWPQSRPLYLTGGAAWPDSALSYCYARSLWAPWCRRQRVSAPNRDLPRWQCT